jgi:hypothetical protein
MCRESKSDIKTFVAKDSLFLSEDGVGEFWVKAVDSSKAGGIRFDKFDSNSLVGVGGPCSQGLALSSTL